MNKGILPKKYYYAGFSSNFQRYYSQKQFYALLLYILILITINNEFINLATISLPINSSDNISLTVMPVSYTKPKIKPENNLFEKYGKVIEVSSQTVKWGYQALLNEMPPTNVIDDLKIRNQEFCGRYFYSEYFLAIFRAKFYFLE